MEENDDLNEENNDNLSEDNNVDAEPTDALTRVSGMYKDWFLDYASYVIRTCCTSYRRWF